MHLKEAYQRRNKQLEASSLRKRSSVNHNPTIGSVHAGHINFDKDQTFFGNFKVRDEVKAAKQYIKNLKDADIFELKDKNWNSSVTAPRKFDDFEKEETHKTKILKIRLGLSGFSPVRERPNKIYPGTQSRDNYKGWNVSTYFQKSQKKQGLESANVNALENTLKYNSSNFPNNYKTLKERYTETCQLNKSALASNSDLLSDIKSSYLFTNPNASPEKTNASTIKIFNDLQRQKMKLQWKQQNQSTQESFNKSFKANLSPTQKQKIKKIYFHTGKWQKTESIREVQIDETSDNENDGYSWSCCLNQSKQSKGCSYRVEDGNKMNLASFSS